MNRHELEIPDITKPLKTKKVKIGLKEESKFVMIGNYWDEETVSKVT